MSRIRVTKEFSFEMAHMLEGYDGPCSEIHGHSYRLFVTVAGTPCSDPQNPKYGMVIDFGVLKRIVGGPHRGRLRPQPGGKTYRRQRRTDKNARRTVRQAAGGGIPAYVRKPRHAFRGDHRGRASPGSGTLLPAPARNGHLLCGMVRLGQRLTAAATPLRPLRSPSPQTQPKRHPAMAKTIPTRRIRPDIQVLLRLHGATHAQPAGHQHLGGIRLHQVSAGHPDEGGASLHGRRLRPPREEPSATNSIRSTRLTETKRRKTS